MKHVINNKWHCEIRNELNNSSKDSHNDPISFTNGTSTSFVKN